MVRQIAILLFQIVLAIGLGIAGIRIASLVNGEATPAPAGLAANTELLWTTSPVRVDPRSQNYERIPTPPDLYPLKMHADQRLRVISSSRFTFKGQEFRLAGVEDVDVPAAATDIYPSVDVAVSVAGVADDDDDFAGRRGANGCASGRGEVGSGVEFSGSGAEAGHDAVGAVGEGECPLAGGAGGGGDAVFVEAAEYSLGVFASLAG